jgi:hypothetical protein
MATELILRVDLSKLVPASAHDQELLCGMGFGKEYRGVFTSARPRSVHQNRFYWAILGKVVENHPFYRGTKPLHVWIKTRLGYFEEVRFHDGRMQIEVSSTAFDKMDPREFKTYMDAAIDVICTEVIPGLDSRRLVREIENMLGVSYEALWQEPKRRAA